jgi:hypothetical protein
MAFASLFLASCSDDDITEISRETVGNANDMSYLTVNITTPNTTTRGDDGGYVAGDYSERAVEGISNAHFIFYDADGYLISEANVWAGDSTSEVPGTTGVNVEYLRQNMIIPVSGVNGVNYPVQMITLLNEPSDFKTPYTISEVLPKLQGSIDATSKDTRIATSKNPYMMTKDNKDYFTMTTTSYARSGDEAGVNYFVTKLVPENFCPTEDSAKSNLNTNVVDVYVERLAVKTSVKLNPASTTIKTIGTDTVYSLTGKPSVTLDGTSKNIYVKFEGWGVNCLNEKSYLFKHLDATAWGNPGSTTDGPLYFTWNIPDDHRSYWGASYNYDLDTAKFYYPYRYIASPSALDKAKGKMTYISADELTKKIGSDVAYCPENTNTAAVLNSLPNYKAAVTSVLLKARIVDENGANLDVIRLNGRFYTRTDYPSHVIAALVAQDSVPFYTTKEVTEGDNTVTKYIQIAASNVEIADADSINGRVILQLTDAAKALTWYQKSGDTYTEVTAAAVNRALANFNSKNHAIAYNQGLMYYNIPIEHLNNKADLQEVPSIGEGVLGVVRNHYYQLTVTEIANLGHGVEHPDEPIVPPVDEEKEFYIKARVNILAWHVITQNVKL